MKSLAIYRGATIYQKGDLDPSLCQVINIKLFAKGRMPDPDNLLVHFDAEASSQNEALNKIMAQIDRFLSSHQLKRLKSEHKD